MKKRNIWRVALCTILVVSEIFGTLTSYGTIPIVKAESNKEKAIKADCRRQNGIYEGT